MGVCAVFVVLLVMLTNTPAWGVVPGVLKIIQFPYRLQTYVVLLVSALVIIGLRAVSTAPRRGVWMGSLVAVLVVGAGLAEWQIWTARTYLPISASYPPEGVAPVTWYDNNYILKVRPPVLEPAGTLDETINSGGDRVLLTGIRSKDRDLLYATNIVRSPFTRIEGRVRGIGSDASGRIVVVPTPGPSGSPFTGAVAQQSTPATTLGLIATVLGLLGCGALLVRMGVRRRLPG